MINFSADLLKVIGIFFLSFEEPPLIDVGSSQFIDSVLKKKTMNAWLCHVV